MSIFDNLPLSNAEQNPTLTEKLIPVCKECITIQKDFLGNVFVLGPEKVIDEFYKRPDTGSFDRTSVESHLRNIVDSAIQGIKQRILEAPSTASGADAPPAPITVGTIQETLRPPARIRYSNPDISVDSTQNNSSIQTVHNPPKKKCPPQRRWGPEEDRLLIESINEFKENHPGEPFWDNPLSEVSDKIWDEINTIYRVLKDTDSKVTKKPYAPGCIKQRWQEILCPLLIAGAIRPNGINNLSIRQLYREATRIYGEEQKDLTDRCRWVEKEFCRNQKDGHYYSFSKIRLFVTDHILETTRPVSGSAPAPSDAMSNDDESVPIENTAMAAVPENMDLRSPVGPHKWTPEEDRLLTSIVTAFKTNNPGKPFWDNPLSEVDSKTWSNIAKIYQSFAEASELDPIPASSIESRWQEALCPLVINGAIHKNGHGTVIEDLYDASEGDLEARCKSVGKEFCRSQRDGTYYPLKKIKAFMTYCIETRDDFPNPQNTVRSTTLDLPTIAPAAVEATDDLWMNEDLPDITDAEEAPSFEMQHTRSSTDVADEPSPSKRSRYSWKEDSYQLLRASIENFKADNPETPFWDNPLSEVAQSTWTSIARIYQSQAKNSGLKTICPAEVARLWKEILCPSLIAKNLSKNSNDTKSIIDLYNRAAGDFEARCKTVEKEFCRERNGSYYPLKRIKDFMKKTLSQNSANSDLEEDTDRHPLRFAFPHLQNTASDANTNLVTTSELNNWDSSLLLPDFEPSAIEIGTFGDWNFEE